jgi:hypothetical protein
MKNLQMSNNVFAQIGTTEFNMREYGRLKVVGTTDSVTICFCCNKKNLKKTAVMQDSDGNYSFFGTSCAYNASRMWDTKDKRCKEKVVIEVIPDDIEVNICNRTYILSGDGFSYFINKESVKTFDANKKSLRLDVMFLQNKNENIQRDILEWMEQHAKF